MTSASAPRHGLPPKAMLNFAADLGIASGDVTEYMVRPRPRRLSAIRVLHRESGLYGWRVCMGARGASRPHAAVSGASSGY
jgi:hypothetical protein